VGEDWIRAYHGVVRFVGFVFVAAVLLSTGCGRNAKGTNYPAMGEGPISCEPFREARELVDTDRFTLVIADLGGDEGGAAKDRLVREAFDDPQFEREGGPKIPQTIGLSARIMRSKDGDARDREREVAAGHARAKEILRCTGIDALVWGDVEKVDGDFDATVQPPFFLRCATTRRRRST